MLDAVVLLHRREAAERLRVSVCTVKRARSGGEITHPDYAPLTRAAPGVVRPRGSQLAGLGPRALEHHVPDALPPLEEALGLEQG